METGFALVGVGSSDVAFLPSVVHLQSQWGLLACGLVGGAWGGQVLSRVSLLRGSASWYPACFSGMR